MWKNFKMSTKLLLTFGLLLTVFAGSVFVTWRTLSGVIDVNTALDEQGVPSMLLGTRFERSAYEVFLAAKDMEHKGTDESVAAL
ncbi:MAG: hypothetical protein LBL51_01280, partial [Synergistaceae bacterium]|nr:hypothetical protein [Synergistaceae bacterium]